MARLRGGDLAGLAGLGAAAYLLSKKKGDSAAIEREEDVGGLRSSGKSGSDEEEVSVAAPMSDAEIRSKIEAASPAKYAGGEGGPARRAARAAVFGGSEHVADSPQARAEAKQGALGRYLRGRPFNKGGAVKTSKPTMSSASKRADGIAQRGKTRGKMY